MGIMIDMPAAIIQQANEYAERSGCTFHDLLCLSVKMYLAEQARRMSLLGKSGSMHFWTVPKAGMKSRIDLIVPMHTNPRWHSHKIH